MLSIPRPRLECRNQFEKCGRAKPVDVCGLVLPTVTVEAVRLHQELKQSDALYQLYKAVPVDVRIPVYERAGSVKIIWTLRNMSNYQEFSNESKVITVH